MRGRYEYHFTLHPLNSLALGPSRMRVKFVVEMQLSERELLSEPPPRALAAKLVGLAAKPPEENGRPRSAGLGRSTSDRAEQVARHPSEHVHLAWVSLSSIAVARFIWAYSLYCGQVALQQSLDEAARAQAALAQVDRMQGGVGQATSQPGLHAPDPYAGWGGWGYDAAQAQYAQQYAAWAAQYAQQQQYGYAVQTPGAAVAGGGAQGVSPKKAKSKPRSGGFAR